MIVLIPRAMIRFLPSRLFVTRVSFFLFLLFLFSGTQMTASVFDPTKNTFQYRTRIWQVESGQPQNAVQAVAQTGDGFLWLGTQHGLVRFDGTQFEWVDHEVLRTEKINALTISSDGSLWVGTTLHGVYRMHSKTISHFSLAGIADDRVLSLCADPDGSLLIGTLAGVARFNGTNVVPARENAFINREAVRAITRRPDGAHWFATSGQIVAIGKSVPIRRLTAADGIRSLYIRALLVDDKGVLWMGSNAGLSCLKKGKLTHFTKAEGLPDNTVSALFEDSHKRVWVGTFNGLSRKEDDEFVRVPSENGEPFDQIFTIVEDREKNVWAGFKNGLIRLREDRFKTYLSRDGLAHNNVISVLRDDAGLWVGTWGGGLHYFKDGTVTVWTKDTQPTLKNELILAMHKTRDGSLWFGTDYDGGLHRLKDGHLTRFNEAEPFRSQAIRAIHEDRFGDLWIATSFELIRRRGEQFQKFHLRNGLPHTMIRCLAEDLENKLWVGTDNGLVYRNGERFERVPVFAGLPSQTILSLYADNSTNLWIGTAGGLACWNGEFVQSFAGRQPLLTNAIVEILEDDFGFFWLSSHRGIIRVKKNDLLPHGQSSGRRLDCELFGKEDGMISSVCVGTAKPSASKSADGTLWFATTRGLVTTDSRSRSEANPIPPPVFITKFIINKNAIPLGDEEIVLTPGSDSLEFEYTALSFRDPERNRFKYKLVGFDSEWVDAGTRRAAFYNNLSPGTYEFKVIACNNDGIWNEDGTALAFSLEPHFWQMKSFQAAVFLGLAFLAGAGARHFTKTRMEARLARLEQEHALEKERTRIAQDMHDELGARITEILLVGKSTLHKEQDLAVVRSNVDKICSSAQEIATDLNAIVFSVNPQNDSLEHFVAYIYKYVEKYLGSASLRCRIDLPFDVPDLPVSSEVRHHVLMAIKEALNNILKHAEATEIALSAEIGSETFVLSIKDNGKGFRQHEVDRLGNGLTGMRKRMEEVRGRFEICSEPGKGTRIQLQVPLKG